LDLIKQIKHNCTLSFEVQRNNLPEAGFRTQVAIGRTNLKHRSKRRLQKRAWFGFQSFLLGFGDFWFF
jgi:ATP sulfurylase